MSDEAARLYRKDKPCGHGVAPGQESLPFRDLVKGIVDLYAVEVVRIVIEIFLCGEFLGIKDSPPMPVAPSGCSNMNIRLPLPS